VEITPKDSLRITKVAKAFIIAATLQNKWKPFFSLTTYFTDENTKRHVIYNSKFSEELIAYVPLMGHEPQTSNNSSS
jgi:hypothetical protein